MTANLRYGVFCLSLLFLPSGYAQEQQERPPAQPQPAQQPSSQPRPAQEKPAAPESGGEKIFSLELSYGVTTGHPALRGRADSGSTTPSDLVLPGKNRGTPGAVLSFPGGRYNAIRISYFQTRGGGDTIASNDVNLFSTGYSQGDLLSVQYKLQNVKISYDYLSYPVPPGDAKFRLKTLWEVQYTNFKSTIDAPLKNPANPGAYTTSGSRWFVYPSLGLGIEHSLSKNFRWEAKGSGFGVPHHADIWSAEAWAAYRVGRFEPRFGFRAFHFKTSPKKDQYVGGTTFPGLYVNLRWYPKS